MTRPADARIATDLGVDAIGLVFVPGAGRSVSLDRAREIRRAVGPWVTVVGVFADASIAEIRSTTNRVGLDTVQLHGQESPDMLAELQPLRVIKTLQSTGAALAEAINTWSRISRTDAGSNLTALLLDSGGGSGVPNDWDAVATSLASVDRAAVLPIIVAGGLAPETVAAVVKQLHPHGVDVSSGIESTKGIKSAEKMAAFARNVSLG